MVYPVHSWAKAFFFLPFFLHAILSRISRMTAWPLQALPTPLIELKIGRSTLPLNGLGRTVVGVALAP